MKITSPLSLFIIVSITIHAGVVLFSNNPVTITLPSTQGSAFAIKVKQITVKTNNIEKSSKKQIVTTALNSVKKIKTKKITNKEPKQENITSEKKTSLSKAQVISIIYEQLNQHFTYPKLAQKRNWQGKVLLSLRISANGKIDNVQLKHSSGYRILDDAALRALLSVKTLPKIASWLSTDLYLNLPVIYQLTEG